ncbi:hypothetical protein DBL01_00875 [Acinetobacter pittii]|nr:hypothetical protein DBL01_00875 [Acinetobacter pittii]
MELKLNLKLVKGPIHSLEKAKSKIPVKQNIGGIAAGTAFAGVLAESSSLLTSAPILIMAAKAKEAIQLLVDIYSNDRNPKYNPEKANYWKSKL